MEQSLIVLSQVVVCVCLAGLFACIAALVWEPGLRQGWKEKTSFFAAVVLGTGFAVASLVLPWLEIQP